MRKTIDKILAVICIIMMALLVVDVLWQVVSRFVIGRPSAFTDELAGYLFIWVGLLGAAYVTGQRGHLAIDLLIQRSNGQFKKALIATTYIIVSLFALFVFVIGGGWLVYTRFLWDVRSAALGLPLGLIYSVVPISGLFIIYYTIGDFIDSLKSEIE